MSDIDNMLQKLAEKRKHRPLSVNAEDLLFKGHITAEESAMICKGEDIAMSIKFDQEPKVDNIQLGDLDTARILEEAKKTVLNSATEWIPKQINNVLIRVKIAEVNYSDPTCPTISVRIVLLDIAKETQQHVATDIPVYLQLITEDAENDRIFWQHFQQTMTNQFQQIALQLIHSLNNDKPIIPEEQS